MSDRTRTLSAPYAFIALVGALLAQPAAWAVAVPRQWETTIAVRVIGGTGKPMTIRLAVPPDARTQRVIDVEVKARGLTLSLERDDDHPHILLSGRLKGARRISATYHVETNTEIEQLPKVRPLHVLAPELVPFVSPAPLFQSRSVLVRDFLESEVAPLLASDPTDVLRAIFEVARREIKEGAGGKSLTLDVVRRRLAKHIGIERAFTTFLRCAQIPARMVEGVNLRSSTKRKRVFWTEVWAENRWWPVSASQGWIGELPAHYLALARDGTRVLRADGGVTATYSVQARRVRAEELRD